MFKKITAILLSITLLLTISPVTGVFAAVSETNGTLTENFEGMNVTDDYFGFTGSQLENHAFFTNSYDTEKTSKGTFNGTLASYKIVEKQGADGQTSKMLEMRSPEGSGNAYVTGLGLPSYVYDDHTAGKRFTYSFDFCIENIPDSAVFKGSVPYLSMFYYNTGGGLFSNSDNFNANNFVVGSSTSGAGTYQAKLTEGSWYRAEMIADGGSDGNDSAIQVAVYDKNTGTALFKVTGNSERDTISPGKSLSSTKPHQRLLAGVALAPVETADTGFTVLIDNAEYRVCKPVSSGPALKTGSTFTEATIKNGDTVALNVGEVTVAFDQKLAEGYKATLTPAGGTSIECAMTAGKTYATTSFYTVTIPELAVGTNYTLSFENCKNSQNAASASTITFKTLGEGPEIQTSTLEDGGEISPVSPKATVTFDQTLASGSKVVVYKDGGEALPCTLVNTSGYTYEITLPELEDGENYTLDFTGCFNEENTPSKGKISFTTKVVRIVKLTDDFETDYLGTNADNNYKGYNTSKNSAYSPLYSAAAKNYQGTIYRSEGYNGGNALTISTENASDSTSTPKLHTPGYYPLSTNPDDPTEYEKCVVTYRFKIDQAAPAEGEIIKYNNNEYKSNGTAITFYTNDKTSSGAVARIDGDSNGKLLISADNSATAVVGEDAEVFEDRWYNIVWVFENDKQTFNFIDAQTGKLVFTGTGTGGNLSMTADGYQIGIFSGITNFKEVDGGTNNVSNYDQIVSFDDFTLWKIKPWENEHKLIAEVSGGETTNMIFNQPVIGAENMFVVNKVVNSENVPSSATPVFTYPDFCKMTVNYNGLRYMTDYTVDYSDLVSAGGARFLDTELATKTISFSVGKDSKDLTLIGDISYNDLKEGDVVTANIQKDTDGTACIFIAFYDSEGDIMSADSQKNIAFNAGEPTPIKFELQGDMSECRTIKVFGWDSLERITPIMSVYVEYR